MAGRSGHLPGLAEGRPGKIAEIIYPNFPLIADFTKCPFISKVVVSRRRNDRFAKWYSWLVPWAGILFSKVVSLRSKMYVFGAAGLR